MSSRIVCLVAIVLLVCSLGMTAQTAPAAATPQATTPTIKHVPAAYTTPSSGKEMFNAYCASCHGTDAKGDGPAAPALKMPTTNLTTLSCEEWRHVSSGARRGCDSGRCHDACPRQQGHAGVGPDLHVDWRP